MYPWLSSACTRRGHRGAGSHRGDLVLLCWGSFLQQILYLHLLLG